MKKTSILTSASNERVQGALARNIAEKEVAFSFLKGRGSFTDSKRIVTDPYGIVEENIPHSYKVWAIRHLTIHEALHVLMTDFNLKKIVMKPFKSQIRKKIAGDIANILEDSRIELAGANYLPGIKRAVQFGNELAFIKRPKIHEIKNPLMQFIETLLQKAIVGKVKGDIPKQIKELVNEELIRKARYGKNSNAVAKSTLEFMKLIEPLIQELEDEFEYKQQTSDDVQGQRSDKPKEMNTDDFQEIHETSSSSNNSDEDEDSDSDSAPNGSDEDSDGDEDSDSNSASNGSDEDSDGDEDSDSNSASNGSDEDSDGDEDSDSNSASNGSDEDSDGDEDSDSNSASNGSDEDSDRNEDSDSEDSDEDDLKKLQEEFEDLLEDAENELEELEEEEKNRKHEEEETLEDIRLGGVDVSNINKNLSFEIIESNITYNVKYNFNSAYREIKNEIKTTKKLIERILKYRNSTQKKRNQRRGRIHGSKLYKVQLGKEDVFYRKDETNVDLAIILLIDESGSMREYNRYIEARKTAILFKKVLNALNIPHAIWGFQAVYQEHKVEHREYVTFENYKKQKDEILGAISYRDNSRNGFTIRLATNELLKRPEKKKVLIEISDGQPFHNYGYGYYYDEVSMTDTHKSVVEARKKGVYPLGLSIAEKGSHEYMKKIHRDYLCIENVEMLPKQFAKILQKIILA